MHLEDLVGFLFQQWRLGVRAVHLDEDFSDARGRSASMARAPSTSHEGEHLRRRCDPLLSVVDFAFPSHSLEPRRKIYISPSLVEEASSWVKGHCPLFPGIARGSGSVGPRG